MRSSAQVNQTSAFVSRSDSFIWYLAIDQILFVRITCKHAKRFLFAQYNPLERLFFLNDFLDLFLDLIIAVL